jgi:hypothetical protein
MGIGGPVLAVVDQFKAGNASLVTASVGPTFNYIGSAELYDPSTGPSAPSGGEPGLVRSSAEQRVGVKIQERL